jgi:hypothetical protein
VSGADRVAAMNEMLESVLHEVEMLPEAHQQRIVRVIKEELSRAKREVAVTPGRWARLAERLSKESPLEGRSEEVLRRVREFREGFEMMEPERTE